jgi:uracil-DNA glycosylase
MRVLVVLDTMWGDQPGRQVRFFPINPNNHSGKRLYKLLGFSADQNLWVTNACRYMTDHATKHGKPDTSWLYQNLERFKPDFVLVCGNVANKCYEDMCYRFGEEFGKVFHIPHPAARTWTKESIRMTARRIRKQLRRFKNENHTTQTEARS